MLSTASKYSSLSMIAGKIGTGMMVPSGPLEYYSKLAIGDFAERLGIAIHNVIFPTSLYVD